MRTSANILIAGTFVARRSTDLLLAWSDAADDAHAAYLAWRDAEPVRTHSPFTAPRSTAKRRPPGRFRT